jgi:hypothetical protein
MKRADKIMIAFGLAALVWAWSDEIVALVYR